MTYVFPWRCYFPLFFTPHPLWRRYHPGLIFDTSLSCKRVYHISNYSGDSYSSMGYDVQGAHPSAENPFGNPPYPGRTYSGGPTGVNSSGYTLMMRLATWLLNIISLLFSFTILPSQGQLHSDYETKSKSASFLTPVKNLLGLRGQGRILFSVFRLAFSLTSSDMGGCQRHGPTFECKETVERVVRSLRFAPSRRCSKFCLLQCLSH